VGLELQPVETSSLSWKDSFMRKLIGMFLAAGLAVMLGCTQPKPSNPAKVGGPSVELKPGVIGSAVKGNPGEDENKESTPPAKKDVPPPPPGKNDNTPPAEKKEPPKT
jgi:hypothetical protein